MSGHPVIGAISTDWGATHDGVQNPTAVAYSSVTAGCSSCHDYVDPSTNNKAFPHNRLGTRLWMTTAADAGAAHSPILDSAPNNAGDLDYYPTSVDGACLKCHVAAGGLVGVGRTF